MERDARDGLFHIYVTRAGNPLSLYIRLYGKPRHVRHGIYPETAESRIAVEFGQFGLFSQFGQFWRGK